jgi:hypothetical protein
MASYLCQPLYQVFLDLTKAYDTLDHDHTLSILEAYGVGPHIRATIQTVWELLLHHYAQSHSALYGRCIMSTPIGSGAHRQMWWN